MRAFLLADEAATIALGGALSRLAGARSVFALSGPLGAGKTCLARGLIVGLQPLAAEEIVSPTFTLVQTYPTVAGRRRVQIASYSAVAESLSGAAPTSGRYQACRRFTSSNKRGIP